MLFFLRAPKIHLRLTDDNISDSSYKVRSRGVLICERQWVDSSNVDKSLPVYNFILGTAANMQKLCVCVVCVNCEVTHKAN